MVDFNSIIQLVGNMPMLVFALVLLNREMKKREEAECRERELLYEVAGMKEKKAAP